MRKKILILALLAFSLASCSNEKKELYEMAVEKVKTSLIAPGSAKFADYSEDANVFISEKAGKAIPMEQEHPDLYITLSEKTRKGEELCDSTYFSMAIVTVDYEAQNAYGVFLKGIEIVYFRKWLYKSGACEWEIIKK